jgi:hypothetical protein
MPSVSSVLVPLRRPLAIPLDRLGRTLDSLAQEVREAIARAIGQAVAEVVREVVRALMEDPPLRPETVDRSSDLRVQRTSPWQDPEAAYWARQGGYDPEEEDDLLYPDAADERWSTVPNRESFETRTPESPPSLQNNRWRQAVKAGCLAAAWWLRRPPGRFSLWTALGVGLAAGLAALVGGPLAAGAVDAAGSGLVLLGLADVVRCNAPAEAGTRS